MITTAVRPKFLYPIVFILFICGTIAGCTGGNTGAGNNNITEASSPTVQRLPFRTGITAANAYSDLFFDSSRIEKFITQQHIESNKAVDIRNFYNNRGNQFAWFNSKGFTEQALAFRSLFDYSKDSGVGRKQLDNRLDDLLNQDSLAPVAEDPQINSTELSMTWRFINYLNDRFPQGKARDAALTELVPFQKLPVDAWVNRSRTGQNIDTKNSIYSALQKQLDQLMNIKNAGGWDTLPETVKLYHTAKASPLVIRLKKRLQVTGQLTATDSTPAYTPALAAAIKTTQAQFGYPHDTVLTSTLLKELNVPVDKRIEQVIVNLERMRWMPELPASDLIMVNIPAFKLYVLNANKQVFDMDIIVGSEGHGTVMFSGDLNQIVLSPYWNLPASIVKKEVLPGIKKNKHYLQEHHMEITGQRQGLPVVRQLPGEWNELGRIKFLFPNSLAIYFHDTPHKWLFNKDQRAYSHGCIRLAEPAKLAAYLLKDNNNWTEQKIDSSMQSDKEKYLKINKPVPVLIYYYTAWVDDSGLLQFRKDIYGHDEDIADRLFIHNNPAVAINKLQVQLQQ